MTSSRSRIWSIGAVLCVVGVTACSTGGGSAPDAGAESSVEGVPSLEIVSQPEAVGDPISLDLPLDDSGAFAYDQWPSACDLADEKTLTAMFPQADEVVHEGSDRQVSVLSLGADGPRRVTVVDADCTTAVGFPFEGLAVADPSVVVNITTSIEAAGGEGFVSQNTTPKGAAPVQVGDAACTSDDDSLRFDCELQNIAFAVVLDARPHGQYFGEGESPVIVDGEEIVYSSKNDDFIPMAREKVLVPLVNTIVERLAA
ncbi:hypothetical protein ACFWHR_00610 [Leucobacter sp. NPDC058333]|uniref:hypothetical protein n=1 Tax=Leucobacter sp. NPDC058333 TaxID=3346450 RepID=UPI0036570E3F